GVAAVVAEHDGELRALARREHGGLLAGDPEVVAHLTAVHDLEDDLSRRHPAPREPERVLRRLPSGDSDRHRCRMLARRSRPRGERKKRSRGDGPPQPLTTLIEPPIWNSAKCVSHWYW